MGNEKLLSASLAQLVRTLRLSPRQLEMPTAKLEALLYEKLYRRRVKRTRSNRGPVIFAEDMEEIANLRHLPLLEGEHCARAGAWARFSTGGVCHERRDAA